jgi:hypothetical protein
MGMTNGFPTANFPTLTGAYPKICLGSSTASLERTLYNAPEYPAPRTATPSQGSVIEYYQPASKNSEGTGHRLWTSSSSLSFTVNDDPSVSGPTSSHTSCGGVRRKPTLRSVSPAAVQTPTPTPPVIAPTAAPTPAQAPIVAPPSPRHGPIQYHFNGPVTVKNYNIRTDGGGKKISMLKQVLTESARLIKHKDGAGLDIKSVAEATNAIKITTASLLGTGAAMIKKLDVHRSTLIDRHVDAPPAPVSEAAEVMEINEPFVWETMGETGSVYTPTPANRRLFLMNPDQSRSRLASPETGLPSTAATPVQYQADVPYRPSTPVNQMIGNPSLFQTPV